MERAPKPAQAAVLLAVAAFASALPGRAQDAPWGPVELGYAGSTSARRPELTAVAADDPARSRLLQASSTITAGGLAGLVDGSIEARMAIDSTRSLAASISGVGYGSYRLVTLGAAVSMPVGTALVATAGGRIETQSVDGYGVAAAVLLDAAATMRLSATLSVGVAARNLTGSRLRSIARAQTLSLGTLVRLDDSADISLDIEHVAGRGLVAACAGSMMPAPGVVVRGGVRLDGSIVAAGFGLDDGAMLVDVAVAWIDALGMQCAAGVGLRW